MTPPGPRRSADERREDVLRVAAGAFAAGGLYGTSTEEIALRAGISQPYIFRLYPTKKALFLALVERCFARVAETFTAAAEGKTGAAAMEAMGGAYTQMLADRELLLVQMQTYAACGDDEIKEVTRRGFRSLWQLVEKLGDAPYDEVVSFFALGMLLNVAAAMDLPAVDADWARFCLEHDKGS